VVIRQLYAAELPDLEWEGEYTHFRRVYARAFQRAQNREAVLWVAATQRVLIGQVFVLLNSDYDNEMADGKERAFIHSFRVRAQYRNAGLGTRLLTAAEDDLRSRNYKMASLNVAEDNDAAIRFYERHGYSLGRRISGEWSYLDHLGHERRVSEPGWRMSKSLTP
jgi:ribosomal protein S18 acetylase RimI-like enzyme